MWMWCSCFSRRDSGSTSYSGGLAARAAGNTVLSKGMATNIVQYAPLFLPGEPLSLTEKPDRPQPTGSQSWTQPKQPCMLRRKSVLTCGSSALVRVSVKVAQLLGLQGPWQCQLQRDMGCLCHRNYGPIRVFF